MIKKGSIVLTEFGKGVIVDIEVYNRFSRYGVKLDNNPFRFTPVYFFEYEITSNTDLKRIEDIANTLN